VARRREAPRGYAAAPWKRLVDGYDAALAEAGQTRRLWTAGQWTCPACGAVAPAEGVCSCIAEALAKT
jgi:hypothetical protein